MVRTIIFPKEKRMGPGFALWSTELHIFWCR